MHEYPQGSRETDWQCAKCGDWKPVQQLARECEERHAELERRWAA